MKSILLFIIGISTVLTINAQWTSTINPSDYSAYGSSIVPDNIGNIYSVGHVFESSTEKENILVVKYSSSGTILWTRTYDHALDSDKAVKAIVDADNNLLIIGTTSSGTNGKNILCLKYSATGDLVKTYEFDGSENLDDTGADIVIGENGNIYVGGTSRIVSQRAFVLIKLDSELEQVWQKIHTLYYGADLRKLYFNSTTQHVAITGNYTDWDNLYISAAVVYDSDGNKIFDENYRTLDNRSSVCFDVITNNDNSVYVCGYEANEESNIWDALLIKYNSDGEISWTKKIYAESLPAFFKYMVADDYGNIYVNGMSGENALTVKYASDGTQVWTQTHVSKSGFSTVASFESIKQSSNGDIFITANNALANGGGAMIVKYNDAGAHQWTQYYNGSASQMDEPVNFCLDINGNSFMIVNSRNSNYYFDMLTVNFLNQAPQSVEVERDFKDICIYPSPATDFCFLENPFSEQANLIIFSTIGSVVYKTDLQVGQNYISLKSLPAGTYFIELSTSNYRLNSKLLVVK